MVTKAAAGRGPARCARPAAASGAAALGATAGSRTSWRRLRARGAEEEKEVDPDGRRGLGEPQHKRGEPVGGGHGPQDQAGILATGHRYCKRSERSDARSDWSVATASVASPYDVALWRRERPCSVQNKHLAAGSLHARCEGSLRAPSPRLSDSPRRPLFATWRSGP